MLTRCNSAGGGVRSASSTELQRSSPATPTNDLHGHVLGDAVLRIVAASVQRLLRPMDTLVRFGGDEFVVPCRDMTLRNGLILAERIRASIERLPFSVCGNDLHVTVSVGVAAAHSRESAWTSLVESADQALYRAKRRGRNAVAPFW